MMIQYQEDIGSSEVLKKLAGTPFELKDSRLIGISYLVVTAYDGDWLIGRLVAGVYPNTTCKRFSQWNFGENRFRSCWVDRIDVDLQYRSQKIGNEMLARAEKYFRSLPILPENSRKNMYLVSVNSAIPFYLKNNWVLIDTPDHPEDEDETSVYMTEIGVWMAKPLASSMTESVLDAERELFEIIAPEFVLEAKIKYGYQDSQIWDDHLYDLYVQEKIKEDEEDLTDIIGLASYRYNLETVQKISQKFTQALHRYASKTSQNEVIKRGCEVFIHQKAILENSTGAQILTWLQQNFQIHLF